VAAAAIRKRKQRPQAPLLTNGDRIEEYRSRKAEKEEQRGFTETAETFVNVEFINSIAEAFWENNEECNNSEGFLLIPTEFDYSSSSTSSSN
jgi:hypothetical protein